MYSQAANRLRGADDMKASETSSDEVGYSIGVASRLTGIQPTTLRIWERRYGLVKPGRSSGKTRVYSEDDDRRLALIKTLVDAGHPISSVAALTIEQLRSRLESASGYLVRPGRRTAGHPRVVVIGHSLPEKLNAREFAQVVQRIEILASFDDEPALRQGASGLSPDVLVVEMETAHDDALRRVKRLLEATGAARAVVVYGFAERLALHDLGSAGIICLRAPVAVADVVSAVRSAHQATDRSPAGHESASDEQVPQRRFTPAQLARISARSPVIGCECPHHLVDLINSLAAFETYSRECENKNPEDAQIHAHLGSVAGRGRAMMEAALERVARFEGIDVS
jgi:DNA-binding transcriptional MerR regulator